MFFKSENSSKDWIKAALNEVYAVLRVKKIYYSVYSIMLEFYFYDKADMQIKFVDVGWINF